VWKYIVSDNKKKEWKDLVRKEKLKNKEGLDQNEEEIFCMIYAQHYAKNKMSKFEHPDLEKFIKSI